MTALRFLRKASSKRNSCLAIVALPDEASAFGAYRLLQYHGISPEHLAIVGQGYSSPDSVGLVEPMQIARRCARRFGAIASVVGTVIGFVLFLICYLSLGWPLDATLILIIPATMIATGFLGAVLGALLAFFGEGASAGIYRHHLRKGHYLLMIEGTEKLVRNAQAVLNQYSAPQTR
ncbi:MULTISPECIES: magnesium transporter [Planktothricoides]|uniref:Magnesium transporter n=2 Tax=Planktothricoides raciborskii TaxID=132608 RepID=A0AAU8JJU3_9CYAN|nr:MULTISPECIES: magnesium transporter [Planktothricoides]KOR34246.1 hypothetical protein AM228_25085 [Planktothricoides sp. SR001]MBD2543800.1 magnesium transporter [Planktothricoides raciborskii FACHB-1370]MBD2582305.1 magnesium transporter [Planktothricoides raciborskii FACHB-1261]